MSGQGNNWLNSMFLFWTILEYTVALKVKSPCTDEKSMEWVRDKKDCSKYYVCHYGQPLPMPRCPVRQVWSNQGLNCVPRGTRWDDCVISAGTENKTTHRQNGYTVIIGGNVHEMKITTPAPVVMATHKTVTQIRLPYGKERSGGQGQNVNNKKSTTKNRLFQKSEKQTAQIRRYKTTSKSPPRRHHFTVSKQNWLITDTKWNQSVFPTSEDSTAVITSMHSTSKPSERWLWKMTTRRYTPLHSVSKENDFDKSSSQFVHYSIVTPPVAENVIPSLKSPEEGWRKWLPGGHPCSNTKDYLIPHPRYCNWYYNCSSSPYHEDWKYWEFLSAECRYPQLFDIQTMQCREYLNVDCGERFEPVDPCEYRVNKCHPGKTCKPCEVNYGSCRNRPNGIYPLNTDKWTPTFVTCYGQRNIAQDDCQLPMPIFSPEKYDCVSVFDVPKVHGGLRPECHYKRDGLYPDESGRCAIYYGCENKTFLGYKDCPPGNSFNPLTKKCAPFGHSPPPCGEGRSPKCNNKPDGFFPDLYGRCPYYFKCKRGRYTKHYRCDFGSFDPARQECVVKNEDTMKPCGLMRNPCEKRRNGRYTDYRKGCSEYIECQNEILIAHVRCKRGFVYNDEKGQCDHPEYVSSPCGWAPDCSRIADGKYQAALRGCRHYYMCTSGHFQGYGKCSKKEGGVVFNPEKRQCDSPHNVCPPCGHRWYGCGRKRITRHRG